MNIVNEFNKTVKKIDAAYRTSAGILIVTAAILLIPFLAMQFTGEVDWSLFDFIVAGVLLSGTGFAYKLLAGRLDNFTYRIAAGITLATGLFMIWSNLAVGIIGSEDNPANWMYLGVLAIGILGAAAARLRPMGMSFALIATALAQIIVVLIVLITGFGYTTGKWGEILVFNGFFILLWMAAALLFGTSARKQAEV